MAKYRQIHIDFWQDGFVLDLTPEEKYFFLFLMTNSKTSQCGIYELPKRVVEIETGYNRDTVDKLLNRFVEYGKILYCDETKEIMIKNWMKYNGIKSPKVIACIKKELLEVKNKAFLSNFKEACIRYGYPIDSLPIDLGEEEEQEEEQEREKEQEEEQEKDAPIGVSDTTPAPSDSIIFFQKNIGLTSPYVSEELLDWIDTVGDELVLYALKRAVDQNKPTWGYAKAILKKWNQKNLKTVEQVEQEQVEFANQQSQKRQNKSGNGKTGEIVPEWFDNQEAAATLPPPDLGEGKTVAEMLRELNENKVKDKQ